MTTAAVSNTCRAAFLGAIAALVFALSAPVQAAALQAARYQGEIRPIETAVALRYRPFAPARFTESLVATASVGDGAESSKIAVTGDLESMAAGQKLAISMRITDLLVDGRATPEASGALARVLVTDLGEIRDYVARSPSGRTETVDRAPYLQILADDLRDFLPKLPSGRVAAGDAVFRRTFNLGPEIGVRRTGVEIASQGTARGLTTFRGRPALLVDYRANGRRGSVDYRESGYRLVDLRTGMLAHTQTTTTIRLAGQPGELRLDYQMTVIFD